MKYADIDQELIKLHAEGLSDRAIQKMLGVSNGVVAAHRRKLGLSSNVKPPQKLKQVGDNEYECSKCEKILPRNMFFVQRAGAKYEYTLSYCKNCKREQAYNWRYTSLDRYIRDNVLKIVRRAKKSGIPCDITPEYCMNLIEKQNNKCIYTGIELEHKPHNKSGNNYSLDKIDPIYGYTMGNVVWTTQRINTIKNNITPDEMKEWMPLWYSRIKLFLDTNSS